MLPEAQAIQGVGWLETRYSTAWKSGGAGSNNWGAIQSGKPPCPTATSFQNQDSNPNPDGTSTFYVICFRKYASPELGASDLVRVGYVRRPSVLAAATAGNLYGVSEALFRTIYYTGFGSTVAQRIANHYKALSSAVRGIAAALSEDVVDASVPVVEPWQDDYLPDNPMILRGSYGPYVKVWQRDVLNDWLEKEHLDALAADGAFGPLTYTASKLWQRAHTFGGIPLKVDGVIGSKSWGAAAEAA